jgi:hypothetical protein
VNDEVAAILAEGDPMVADHIAGAHDLELEIRRRGRMAGIERGQEYCGGQQERGQRP